MQLCPGGLQAIRYAVNKASKRLDWSILRLSYGMNGLMFQARDVNEFGSYLQRRLNQRPPDHIAVEWMAAETPGAKAYLKQRRNAAYRYQLWEHMGSVSSVGNSHRATPKFFDLLADLMVPVETFQLRDCPHDDLSPCKSAAKSPLLHLGKLCASKNTPGKFPKAESLPAGVQVFAGKLRQSCTQVCQANHKACRADLLEKVNTCDTLQAAFACESGCAYHEGPEQPCYVTSHAPSHNLPSTCLVNKRPSTITCGGSHQFTSRVCPCS